MSKNSVLKRSGVFVGAVVVCAAGSFMVATPAQADPACQNYEFPTTGQRMTGRAYSTDLGPESINYPYSGSPSGSINGTTIDFTVAWDNGHRSHYFGTVMGDGHGAGERDDIRAVGAGPDNTTWHTADPMKCIPAAAPQPAAPPAQQAPPPQQAPPQEQQRSDRDGDGLYDDDEIDVYGTNPKEADTDGDDRSDGQEVSDNTDPNNQFD